MKFAVPFFFLATPVLAHPVAQAHSHSVDAIVFGLGLIAIAGTAAFVKETVRK